MGRTVHQEEPESEGGLRASRRDRRTPVPGHYVGGWVTGRPDSSPSCVW